MRAAALAMTAAFAAGACSSSVPETRYYQLAVPTRAPAGGGSVAIAVAPLTTENAYDDQRIVYRLTPYRLDYYNYHHWSATPGTMIGNFLEQAFARSGRFRAVTREASSAVPVTLGGRVVAIEEVDASKTSWLGRIVLELELTDSVTGEVLWAQQLEETEPLATQSPEGLARALTTAMQRITQRVLPVVADLAERQAQAHQAAHDARAARLGP